MKVSSKIIAGFLILMLVALVALANQLSVIHQMQAINHDLSEINMNLASKALRMEQLASIIEEDSRKFFATRDALYERQIDTELRDAKILVHAWIGFGRERLVLGSRRRAELCGEVGSGASIPPVSRVDPG